MHNLFYTQKMIIGEKSLSYVVITDTLSQSLKVLYLKQLHRITMVKFRSEHEYILLDKSNIRRMDHEILIGSHDSYAIFL